LATKTALATNRKNGVFLDTLAAAYADTGQFGEAIRIQKEAIALLHVGQSNLVDELVARLKLYESRSPYREGK
jgi:hypothetical protein